MQVHLINPSHISFGVAVITPRWLYVLAGATSDRWGTPQDVADAVLYFASDEASFVTGQTLCINGGLTPW